MITVTALSVLFALSPWIDLVTSVFLAVVVGGAVCLGYLTFRDVFGHSSLLRRWLRRRREDIEQDEDLEEQAARAAVRNKSKKKWWRRKWPNRYKSYEPGKNYTFPGRLDD